MVTDGRMRTLAEVGIAGSRVCERMRSEPILNEDAMRNRMGPTDPDSFVPGLNGDGLQREFSGGTLCSRIPA